MFHVKVFYHQVFMKDAAKKKHRAVKQESPTPAPEVLESGGTHTHGVDRAVRPWNRRCAAGVPGDVLCQRNGKKGKGVRSVNLSLGSEDALASMCL